MFGRDYNWQKIISDFEASGQSAPAYCKRIGVSLSAFYKHRRRLGAQENSRNDQKFIPVSIDPKLVSESKSVPPLLRITTASGTVLEVRI